MSARKVAAAGAALRLLAPAVMLTLAVAVAVAVAVAPVAGFAQAGAGDAAAPIAALNQGLENAEKNSAQPFQARYDALGPIVDRAFDLPQVLKTIVGLRWSQIPANQQQTLLVTFRAFTICNYVANFNGDSGDHFRILPETRNVGADKVVETEIVPKSGDPTRIDYVMRSGASGWKAVDVLQQGTISQAAVQRSDFRSLLASGNADALIASLQKKVETLSGGSIKP
jgi:phospholipid transport system substrate-binding protein